MEGKKVSIVLGSFFGDEGKGLMTSFLANDHNSLVIRFNGGHQAGHTVIKDGLRHVFASFGSGTLNGAHTYWSEYCTFYPVGYMKEWHTLIDKGITPNFYVHPLAMVTTPYDVEYNRNTEKNIRHGSVGVGFGATVARNEATPYKLYVKDLCYKEILEQKLMRIREYYSALGVMVSSEKLNDWFKAAEEVRSRTNFHVAFLEQIMDRYDNFVFEGAQGIMLDQNFGFFPHVTRSNTTSKNAMGIIHKCGLPEPEMYYTMRSYLTRHGDGPLPGEAQIVLQNNEKETNTPNDWQGALRTAYHSYKMMAYVLDCDNIYAHRVKKNIVISCLDQTDFRVAIEDKVLPVLAFQHHMMFAGFNFLYADKGERIVNTITEIKLPEPRASY